MYEHGERKLSCIGNLKEPDNSEEPDLKMSQSESSGHSSDLRMDLSDDSAETCYVKTIQMKLRCLKLKLKSSEEIERQLVLAKTSDAVKNEEMQSP